MIQIIKEFTIPQITKIINFNTFSHHCTTTQKLELFFIYPVFLEDESSEIRSFKNAMTEFTAVSSLLSSKSSGTDMFDILTFSTLSVNSFGIEDGSLFLDPLLPVLPT